MGLDLAPDYSNTHLTLGITLAATILCVPMRQMLGDKWATNYRGAAPTAR